MFEEEKEMMNERRMYSSLVCIHFMVQAIAINSNQTSWKRCAPEQHWLAFLNTCQGGAQILSFALNTSYPTVIARTAKDI